MEKITLKVTGMSYGSCVNKIETGLKQQTGVEKAKVNLIKRVAIIKYDDSTQTVNKLIETIRDVGYEAEPVK